jgi:hypothetical protein
MGDTLRGLDALHLASALADRSALTAFVAYDARLQVGAGGRVADRCPRHLAVRFAPVLQPTTLCDVRSFLTCWSGPPSVGAAAAKGSTRRYCTVSTSEPHVLIEAMLSMLPE